MSLKLVQAKLSGDGKSCKVTLTSDSERYSDQIEQLMSTEAKNMAIKEAAEAGITGTPGISNVHHAPYPVNVNGDIVMQVKGPDGEELPDTHYLKQIKEYRANFEVTGA